MTNKRSKRKKLLLLIPTGIMILVLSLYPTLRGIYLGFTNYRVGRPIEFNGVDNYVGIYNSGYLGIIFKISYFSKCYIDTIHLVQQESTFSDYDLMPIHLILMNSWQFTASR